MTESPSFSLIIVRATAAESLTCLILSNLATFSASTIGMMLGLSASHISTVSVYITSTETLRTFQTGSIENVRRRGTVASTKGLKCYSMPMINASRLSRMFACTFEGVFSRSRSINANSSLSVNMHKGGALWIILWSDIADTC